jgi:hypothetical protein
VPYDSRTELVGIFASHADWCPAGRGDACRCGPLGYRAAVWDWEDSRWVSSPLLQTPREAREWQREANATRVTEGPPNQSEPPDQSELPDQSEKLFWWAFCYLGLAFVGVAVALFASDIAG